MKTEYLTTSDEGLRRAAQIIRDGGLVGFPTETVYGLGGDALNPASSRAIYAAKGRPSDNPLIVHISELDQIYDLVEDFPDMAKRLAESIWPGPLTMILPKKDIIPPETSGGLNTVGIRFPLSETARRFISLSGTPIAGPSGNLSGHPSPTMWQHMQYDMDGRIDAVIMGEQCIGGIESTVIDMTGELPQILRPGLITPERVTEVLGVPCSYDPAILGRPSENLVPKAPGMKYRHYAPKADMVLFSGSVSAVENAITTRAAALRAEGKNVGTIIYKDGKQAAENLFADLRRMDEEGKDIILASALPENESLNFSVMNRMIKSAGYKLEEV